MNQNYPFEEKIKRLEKEIHQIEDACQNSKTMKLDECHQHKLDELYFKLDYEKNKKNIWEKSHLH